jgi:hypothetical protein
MLYLSYLEMHSIFLKKRNALIHSEFMTPDDQITREKKRKQEPYHDPSDHRFGSSGLNLAFEELLLG